MTDLNLYQFPLEVVEALVVLEEHGWQVNVTRERGILRSGVLVAHYPTMQHPEPAGMYERWSVVRGWVQADG